MSVSLAEGLLPSETTGSEGSLEPAQLRQAPPEFVLALRHLPREGDHETEPVLQVPRLCVGDAPFYVEPLVVQQQPGEGFDQPRLQLVERQPRQENLRRMPHGTRALSVGVAGVAQACD